MANEPYGQPGCHSIPTRRQWPMSHTASLAVIQYRRDANGQRAIRPAWLSFNTNATPMANEPYGQPGCHSIPTRRQWPTSHTASLAVIQYRRDANGQRAIRPAWLSFNTDATPMANEPYGQPGCHSIPTRCQWPMSHTASLAVIQYRRDANGQRAIRPAWLSFNTDATPMANEPYGQPGCHSIPTRRQWPMSHTASLAVIQYRRDANGQ